MRTPRTTRAALLMGGLLMAGFALNPVPPPQDGPPNLDVRPTAPETRPQPPGAPAWTHTCVGGPDDYNCPQGDAK